MDIVTISVDRLRRFSLTRARLIAAGMVISISTGLVLAYLDVPITPLAPWMVLLGLGLFTLWSSRRGLFPRYGLADVPKITSVVDQYGLPFTDMLTAVRAAAKIPTLPVNVRATALRRRARRSFLIAAIAAAWFSIPVTLQLAGLGEAANAALKGFMRDSDIMPVVLILVMIIAPLGVAIWQWENMRTAIRQAMALEQPDADHARALDDRPPTLFLRSFKDDALELPSLQHIRGLGHRKVVRFEEAFANLFSDLGPMVAIGEPGEALPTIGAAKTYFADDEWQSAVLGWMYEARLIALAVGPTAALTWELRNAIECGYLGKLVLILPPPSSSADREARVRRMVDCLPTLGAMDWSRTIVAHVNAENKLVAITAKRPVDVDYQIALVIACFGMLGRSTT